MLLTVDNDGNAAVAYHRLCLVDGKIDLYVEDPTRSSSTVKVDDIMPPWDFALQPVCRSIGRLRAAPGVVQALEESKRRLLAAAMDDDEFDGVDDELEYDDDDDDDQEDDVSGEDDNDEDGAEEMG